MRHRQLDSAASRPAAVGSSESRLSLSSQRLEGGRPSCPRSGTLSMIHHRSSSSEAKATALEQIKKRRKNNLNVYEGDEMSNKVDRISALPDDILVYLLSFVEMKTAGRTSLLSKRWRYVWTQLTDLIFEEKDFFLQGKTADSEKERFCTWVNQVMVAHSASYLNTLRIHFPLYGSQGDTSIGQWVNFALRKNVGNLELNLATFSGYRTSDHSKLYDVFPTFRHRYYGTTLKSLHLEAMFVEGPALENVLSNCVSVESLTLRSCHFYPKVFMFYLTNLKPIHTELVVSSLKLKHLEFRRCSFESIQIFAPQLTSFVLLAEPKAKVEYTNVSSLVDVTFTIAYCYHITHNLKVFSNFSYRLQKLSIYWELESYAKLGFPYLHKGNLLVLTSLIEACPLLHTFKLEVNHYTRETQQRLATSSDDVEKNNHDHAIRAHERLEVVEFVGFDGRASMVELAICLTQHSPLLKKIILDPRCSQLAGGVLHIMTDRENVEGFDFARRQAKLLAQRIRVGVDVVIL